MIGGCKMNEKKDDLKEGTNCIKRHRPYVSMFAVGTTGTCKKSYINELKSALGKEFK